MKRTILILAVFPLMILNACSFLGEVNNSLDYVNEATEHINTLSNFAEEAPQMVKEAALNSEVKKELESQLDTLKEDIEEFNKIDAPSIAEDIHRQLVNKNEALAEKINKAMENGEVAIDKLENTQIFKTINEATTLLNQIEKIGL